MEMEERASLFCMVERQLGKDSLVGAWTTVTLSPVLEEASSVGA